LFEWSKEQQGTVALFQLGAEVRLEDIASLRESFHQAMLEGCQTLLLDLSSVARMDSTGISLLVSTKSALRQRQARLILAGLNPTLRQLFNKTCLDQYFEIYSSRSEALKSSNTP